MWLTSYSSFSRVSKIFTSPCFACNSSTPMSGTSKSNRVVSFLSKSLSLTFGRFSGACAHPKTGKKKSKSKMFFIQSFLKPSNLLRSFARPIADVKFIFTKRREVLFDKMAHFVHDFFWIKQVHIRPGIHAKVNRMTGLGAIRTNQLYHPHCVGFDKHISRARTHHQSVQRERFELCYFSKNFQIARPQCADQLVQMLTCLLVARFRKRIAVHQRMARAAGHTFFARTDNQNIVVQGFKNRVYFRFKRYGEQVARSAHFARSAPERHGRKNGTTGTTGA